MATDQTEEELAAELIREAALMRLRQEIPHALAVDVREIEPAHHGVVVRASVLVETESQKGIVVGRGGAMIRDIGSSARSALGRLWGTEVHLDLTVRVRKRWRDDESMLRGSASDGGADPPRSRRCAALGLRAMRRSARARAPPPTGRPTSPRLRATSR